MKNALTQPLRTLVLGAVVCEVLLAYILVARDFDNSPAYALPLAFWLYLILALLLEAFIVIGLSIITPSREIKGLLSLLAILAVLLLSRGIVQFLEHNWTGSNIGYLTGSVTGIAAILVARSLAQRRAASQHKA